MSMRRNVIMNLLANNYKFLPYSYEYLYHDLVPQKVNKNPDLPSAYQQVEYIESSGTQYIDTGIAIGTTWAFNIRLSIIDSGAYKILTQGNYGLRTSGKNLINYCSSNRYAASINYGSIYFCQGNDTSLVINGESTTPITDSDTPSGNVMVLYNAKAKIYYCKLWNGTSLVRNFVPCYRKSDNVIGLFDTVNQTFYTNAGTGTFTKGNDVTRTVYNKGKLARYEGNSVVVNQWANIKANYSTTINGMVVFSDNNCKITFNGQTTGSGGRLSFMSLFNYTYFNFVQGHKYLVGLKLSQQIPLSISDSSGNNELKFLNIKEPTIFEWNIASANNCYLGWTLTSGTTYNENFYFYLVDLTQMFPFDTPTILTDKRIQNIIAKGYIPYNTGTIEDTDLEGIVSESFNLFNEEWEWGYIDSSTGSIISYAQSYKTTDFIEILPNTEYYCKATLLSFDTPNIAYYDKDKNFVSFRGSIGSFFNHTFTTPANVRYIRITITLAYVSESEFCINRSNTALNGIYKPHNDFVDLAHFKPVNINGTEDEFKALSNGYLFRKKTKRYVFTGNETWTMLGAFAYITFTSSEIPQEWKTTGASKCSNGLTMYLSSSRQLRVYYADNSSVSETTDMNTLFSSGTTLDYELNTYQVSNMPLRKLGMVDLSTLSWSYNSDSNFKCWYSNDLTNLAKFVSSYADIANFVMLGISYIAMSSFLGGSVIGMSGSNSSATIRSIFVRNGSSTEKPTGYLYYETADIINETDILIYTGTLPLKYQGSGFGTSYDTMEIGADDVVFTRNCWEYVFSGSETWYSKTSGTAGDRYYSALLSADVPSKSDLTGELLCSNGYDNNNPNDIYNGAALGIGIDIRRAYVCIPSGVAPTTVFSSGVVLKYQLATPQVTRIPKKYIKCVRVRDLTISYSGDNIFNLGTPTGIKPASSNDTIANVYCHNYMSGTFNQILVANNDMLIGVRNTGVVYIKDKRYTTTTDFVNAHGNDIIYYETTDENELPDILSVQPGGEVSSYEFEWVENQIQKVLSTNNFNSLGTSSFVVNDDIATITKGSSAVSGIYQSNYIDNTHIYLTFADVKIDDATSYQNVFLYGRSARAFCSGTTNWQTLMLIFQYNDTSGNTSYPRVQIESAYTGTTVQVKNFNFVDLTLAFGSGKEPTTTSDPRIQAIIEKGYIPTNVNGSLAFEETQILPNATLKYKSKN